MWRIWLAACAALLALPACAKVDRVLGIAVAYTNKGSISESQIPTFGGYIRNTGRMFAEGSGGAHTFDVTVHHKVLRLAQARPSGACVRPQWESVYAELVAAGIDVRQYDRVMMIAPTSASGCTGGVALSTSWTVAPDGRDVEPRPLAITWSLNQLFVAHELGHTFGLPHAGSIVCGPRPLWTRCSAPSTYGNVWDTMGRGNGMMQFQAMFRAKLGWIKPVDHPAGTTATYRLGPAYTTGALPNALRVVMPPIVQPGVTVYRQPTLWIEWRKPVGFDARASTTNFQRGAMINVEGYWRTSSTAYVGCFSPCLLDMHPGTNGHYNGALEVGEQWVDEMTGLKVRVDELTEEALTVTVTWPTT